VIGIDLPGIILGFWLLKNWLLAGQLSGGVVVVNIWKRLQRLLAKQQVDQRLWTRHIAYLENFLQQTARGDQIKQLKIEQRLERAHTRLVRISAPDYPQTLVFSLGTDPSCVAKV